MDKVRKFVKDWVVPAIIALVIALLINRFLFYLVLVPTESMVPTIKPNDRVFVTRLYDRDKLERGDIVVFKSEELGITLVKRLIGLPNDEIEITDQGDVIINGEMIKEPYVVTNNSKPGIFKVPEDEYFFLGDNRPKSFDSRYWKDSYISEDKLQGKAMFILFPFNRVGGFSRE